MLLIGGVVWCTKRNVMVDYSEYLGNDYVYRYDGAGIFVLNHITLLDLIIEIYIDSPLYCLLGKREAQSIPFLKWLIDD